MNNDKNTRWIEGIVNPENNELDNYIVKIKISFEQKDPEGRDLYFGDDKNWEWFLGKMMKKFHKKLTRYLSIKDKK